MMRCCIMEFLIDLSKINPMYYVLAGTLVLVLIAGTILFNVFILGRSRQRRMAKDLEKKYSSLHNILTDDIEQYIARLEFISKQNEEYVAHHEKYLRIYHEILQENDRGSYVAITGLNSTISEKKYKGLKNLIDSTRQIVNEFDRKVTELYNQLSELLQKDEEFRQDELSLQRKFRTLKEKYEENRTELSLMEDSFNKFFERIEKLFAECEELTSGARYEEANEKLPMISQVLDALSEQFEKLPAYCIRVTRVIPKRMEDVQVKYDELEAKDFPLHHLKVMSKLESYKNTLDDISKRLCQFNLKNVEKELDEIDNEIIEIFKEFDDEENAKVFFDENCEKMYTDTYELENKFKKIKRTLPSYKEVYLIKDKYLAKVEELEEDINNIQIIKRDLDQYIHSSTRQPYTIIVNKINDMQGEMDRINEILKDFNSYLVSLKKDSENDYRAICDYFLKLKDAQYTLREMAVPSYSDRLNMPFERSYNYLEQIGEVLKVKPIDVARANEILQTATELIDGLLKDVQEQSAQRKYAEESIVYANQYRQGFVDCKYALKSAGQSFYEGDFTRTIDQTVSIIKKMRPEVKQ